MTYVFDTSRFIVLGHYFPDRFPSFWRLLEQKIVQGEIVSVREVLNELDTQNSRPHLRNWVKKNKSVFAEPTGEEMRFVSKIFAVAHFRQLVSAKQRLKGTPVADPFVVAAAKVRGGCVVTEETWRDNGARIPNVCRHFGIDCTNLDGFMGRENWTF